MSDRLVKDVMAEVDVDGNGQVDLDEFYAVFDVANRVLARQG